MGIVFVHLETRQAESLAHANDLVRGQSAAAHAAFMATAVHLRFDAHARFAPHIQCAYAFRAIGFVAGQTHQINWQSRHIDRHAACGLRSIHMKNDAALAADFSYGRDVLNHADFVVHKHDRSQNRIGAQSRFKDF